MRTSPTLCPDKPAVSSERAPPVRPKFGFPLPIDPIRLMAGALSRWPIMAVCAAMTGTMGAMAGAFLHKPVYSINVSLLKRPVPQTVQTSETGQAYRPSEMNDATLLATLLSTEPIDLALQRIDNGLSPGQIRSRIEAKQLSGTDIFFLTYHSPVSPEDAFTFSTVWAEEINNYTKTLQRADALSTREFLENEVGKIDNQIATLNQQILKFSKETEYVGADTQVSSALGQLSAVGRDLINSRIALEAQEKKMTRLHEEIRKQSPLDSQLKAAKAELAQLRATYTDLNPLVQAKLKSIEYIKEQLADLEGQGPAPLEYYTGTTIGTQLFMEILTLSHTQAETKAKVAAYEVLHNELTAKVATFPEIVSRYGEFQHSRSLLIKTRSLLGNRLKEATIFSSSAPGFWKIFQPPDVREVSENSAMQKPMLLGVAGGMAGAAVSLALLLLFTNRSARRSVLECCAATKGPLLVHIGTGADESSYDTLWIATLAKRRNEGQSILIWTGLAEEEDEARFWQGLAQAAQRDGVSPITVEDLTPEESGASTNIEGLLYWVPRGSAQRYRAFLRLRSLPDERTRPVLGNVDYWCALTTGTSDSIAGASRFLELASPHLSHPDGTIVLGVPPKGIVRKAGEMIALLLTKKFSQPPAPVPEK